MREEMPSVNNKIKKPSRCWWHLYVHLSGVLVWMLQQNWENGTHKVNTNDADGSKILFVHQNVTIYVYTIVHGSSTNLWSCKWFLRMFEVSHQAHVCKTRALSPYALWNMSSQLKRRKPTVINIQRHTPMPFNYRHLFFFSWIFILWLLLFLLFVTVQLSFCAESKWEALHCIAHILENSLKCNFNYILKFRSLSLNSNEKKAKRISWHSFFELNKEKHI